jgi:parallel beta-helix repeat protein
MRTTDRPVARHIVAVALVSLGVGCGPAVEEPTRIEAGPGAQQAALEAFVLAEPGDVIEFGPGRFELDTTLSLDVAGVTVRGVGMEETILDFASQVPGSGGEGLMVTADDFTIEDLAIYNTRADGIKVEGTRGATFRRVFVNWEGEPRTENGAYGLYPVQVTDVLIEDNRVRGCSDAGIYVGQSRNIVVRRNETWENVAGIEIENSVQADVYENKSWGNAGGILVFSLPELPIKGGRDVRVFNNEIWENNHPNFGPPGAIVSTIPPGSGLIVMANDNTEIFDNVFRDNASAQLSIVSFLTTGREYDDPAYDPFPEGVSVHDNVFQGGGDDPRGAAAEFAELIGEPLPDIVWDGIVDPAAMASGEIAPEDRIYLRDNGGATFVNLDLGAVALGEQPSPSTDASAHDGTLPSPPQPVRLGGDSGASEATL